MEHLGGSSSLTTGLVSIGVPADLPQLPASKGGSRGMGTRGAGPAANYGYGSFTTKNVYGLPGLPKYK